MSDTPDPEMEFATRVHELVVLAYAAHKVGFIPKPQFTDVVKALNSVIVVLIARHIDVHPQELIDHLQTIDAQLDAELQAIHIINKVKAK